VQIKNLEEELGVPLLERHSRGVRATPAGEVLSGYAEDILARVDEAKRAVKLSAGRAQQTLRLGLTPSIVRLVGNDILTELALLLPGVTLHIVEDLSFVIMRQLEQGDLACALCYAVDDNPRFQRTALLEEDLYLMTSQDGAEGHGPIPFREALGRDLALTGQQDVVARILVEQANRIGTTLKVAYQVQSIRAVKNLVAKSVASTVMPYGAADGELRKGEFRARLIVSPSVTRTLTLFTARDRGASAFPAQFNSFVSAVVDRLYASEGPVMRRL
jgi:LysR family nitrogen assimilation transcriptional regulator